MKKLKTNIMMLFALIMSTVMFSACNNELETITPVNNSQLSAETTVEKTEYGLTTFPKGDIKLEDFKKTGKIYTRTEAEKMIEAQTLGESPENALVAITFYENGNLRTPHETNYYQSFPDQEPPKTSSEFVTDIATFREITGLKEASADYAEMFGAFWIFDYAVKFYETREEVEKKLELKFGESRNLSALRSGSFYEETIQNLKKGSILFARWDAFISMYAGHIGGLITDAPENEPYDIEYLMTKMTTIEADKSLGGVQYRTMGSMGKKDDDWSRENTTQRLVLNLQNGMTDSERNRIVSFLKDQVGKRYLFPISEEAARLDRSSRATFYCSKLLWMAYKKELGIDLDANQGAWIMPKDILNSPHLYGHRF